SDGSAAGTRVVRDINPGLEDSLIIEKVDLNGTLFFSVNRFDLWRTDGTPNGTVLVKGGSEINSLTNVNGTLFFLARNTLGQYELWTSDGSAAGTREVKQVDASNLTPIGNKLFFLSDDGVHGRELWVSDGTTAGTQLVKDINPAGNAFNDVGSFPPQLTAVGNRLFFVTTQYPYGGQLWQSDGTEAGTTQVQPSDPSVALRAGELENVNGTLYFYGSSLIDQMGTRSIGL